MLHDGRARCNIPACRNTYPHATAPMSESWGAKSVFKDISTFSGEAFEDCQRIQHLNFLGSGLAACAHP